MSFMTEIEAAEALLGHYQHPAGVRPSGFATRLIEAFEAADPANTIRLMTGFPEFALPIRICNARGTDALAAEVKVWKA
ncbi:hypothetical protein [Glutamicibacter ardleyensis]|uniref:hypothetical protein n=1 Tax=Glutamicibacter ardleyensis TaxID=225894 RepID=UPI003FD662A4